MAKKNNIIVICACPSAQVSAQYDNVARALERYKFHMLFRNASFDESSWPAEMPKFVEWSVLPKPGWVRFLPRALQWLINCQVGNILEKHRPDAVIVHGLYDNTASVQSMRWCYKHKVPYLLRSDGNITKHKHFWRYHLKLIGTPMVKKAKAILSIGTQNRLLYEYFGARPEQFYLAPWEHDYKMLEEMDQYYFKRRDELRMGMGLSDKVVFLFLGRVLKLKGLDVVIPVIKRLRAEGLPVCLLIGGDGPYVSVLKKKHNLAYCEYIEYLGPIAREQVCKLYNCADVFVLGSYEDAWGLVVNEAALCRLPLVVSDAVGAGPDLVKEGLNGYRYPTRDKNALYNCLKRLALDKSLRNEMGQQSSRILKKWRKTASAVEGYKKALDYAIVH